MMTYETVEVVLDSVKKQRNAEEFRFVCRASCPKYELSEAGDHRVLTGVLKQLKEKFPEKDFRVEVKRKDQIVIVPFMLSQWFAKKEQPEGLKKANLKKKEEAKNGN